MEGSSCGTAPAAERAEVRDVGHYEQRARSERERELGRRLVERKPHGGQEDPEGDCSEHEAVPARQPAAQRDVRGDTGGRDSEEDLEPLRGEHRSHQEKEGSGDTVGGAPETHHASDRIEPATPRPGTPRRSPVGVRRRLGLELHRFHWRTRSNATHLHLQASRHSWIAALTWYARTHIFW